MKTPTEDELLTAVEVALHAPSIRNTQPWRWMLRPAGLDLHFDPDRLLPVADPDGRALHLACGAALQHAMLYLRTQGLESDVVHLPDADDPTFLAAVRVTDRVPKSSVAETDRELLYAVLWRRSESRHLRDSHFDEDDAAALRAAAAAEGAHLDVVSSGRTPELLDALESLEESVRHTFAEDPRYAAELAHWVRTDRFAPDGIPPGQDTPEGPVMIVVSAASDDPGGWLDAGAALGRVLLTATVRGLSASPLSSAPESPAARERISEILGEDRVPLAMCFVGFLGDQEFPLPLTPRRAISDILVDPREAS